MSSATIEILPRSSLFLELGEDGDIVSTADVQGTVWGYVDSSNTIVARFEYEAWGNILSSPTETRHEGGSWESRSSNPTSSGAGQQCVYDGAGNLINRGSGSGTPDRVNPDMSILGHILYDVVPYKWNLHLKGPKKAEEIDHATHPPNKGKDVKGNPCPCNNGKANPPKPGWLDCCMDK